MSNMFYGSAPFFIVTNLAKSVDYYCDVLGFDRPRMWDSQPPFAMPKRESIIIMLEQAAGNEVRNNQGKWDAYFWVNDVKALYESFKNNGAIFHYDLEYRPAYGNLEFAVKDPDDYILAFAEEVDEAPVMVRSAVEQPVETKFLHMNPVLASSNVTRDIAWYEEKLGFKNVYDSSAYSDGPIDYAVVGRQNLFLHLQYQFPKDMTCTDIRFQVRNIESLFEAYVTKGLLTPDRLNKKTAWHTSEFGLFDPSGNRITFFEDL